MDQNCVDMTTRRVRLTLASLREMYVRLCEKEFSSKMIKEDKIIS